MSNYYVEYLDENGDAEGETVAAATMAEAEDIVRMWHDKYQVVSVSQVGDCA